MTSITQPADLTHASVSQYCPLDFLRAECFHATYSWDDSGHQVEVSTIFHAYMGTEPLHEKVLRGTSTECVYATGLSKARVTGLTAVYDYHTDHLGSTPIVTSATQSVLFSDSYQLFSTDNGTPTGSESYKFTGKPVSATTGLYYYGARWYDPTIGRFISPDLVMGSIGRPQTLNRYTYVANSPTNYVDPTGLWLETAFDIAMVLWDIDEFNRVPKADQVVTD